MQTSGGVHRISRPFRASLFSVDSPAESSSAIVTLTLSPALDVSSSVDVVAATHKLRCSEPHYEPGGGGINVSRVCRRLGESTVAAVPLGGPIGVQLEALLTDEGIPLRVVRVAAQTRQNISMSELSTGDQYRFVFPGPRLDSSDVSRCVDGVVEAAASSRCLVISGSFPAGVSVEFIETVVRSLPNTKVIVDTSGPALAAAVSSGAYLVKPSARELAKLVGAELRTEAEVEHAARGVVADAGVRCLVVSIGAGGAIVALASGELIRLRAPAVQVRSAVGAGDSMVAGIAVGIQRELSLREACALGVAAGSAAVLTDGTMLCEPADVDELLPLVTFD